MREKLQRLLDRLNGTSHDTTEPSAARTHDCRFYEQVKSRYWAPEYPGQRQDGWSVTYECPLDGDTRKQWEWLPERLGDCEDWGLAR